MFSSRKAAPPAFDNVNQANFEEEEVRLVQQRSDNPQIPPSSLFQPSAAKHPDLAARPVHGAGDHDVHAQAEMAKQYASQVAAPMPGRPAQRQDPEDAWLHIGSAIKMKGSVQDCGVLQVDGHFEASAQSKHLKVAESGIFLGDADVHSAEILGRFEGTLTVKDKLVIRSAGSVAGNVRYGSIAIESGGKISGDIEAILRNEPPEEVVRAEAPASAPVPEASGEAEPPRLNLSDGRRDPADSVAASDTVATSDRVATDEPKASTA